MPALQSTRSRLLLLGALYFAQGVPWGFVTVALVVRLTGAGIGAAAIGGLLAVAQTDDGKNLLRTLYNINGLATAQDSEYESVRTAAKVLNLNLEQELAPR